jgi:DNA primase
MNCSQAKQIPIIGFLASQGKHPVKIRNGQAIFHSPFKEDKDPSLYVDFKKYSLQVWKDFSTGAGGNILDLVMKMYNVDIPGALLILQKPEIAKTDFSFFSQQETYSTNIEIKHLQPLQNAALVQYLAGRKISQAKAVNYVQEAYYSVNGNQYFALAFKNDRGGFELRNKYFKGSTSPKAPTTISGHKQAVNIFEGFIDFLSALEHYHTTKPTGTCIVLNSVSNLEPIINTLEQYQQINLYLDNDQAGELAAETIKATHPKVKDYSKIIYPDHKDFNEFLINKTLIK